MNAWLPKIIYKIQYNTNNFQRMLGIFIKCLKKIRIVYPVTKILWLIHRLTLFQHMKFHGTTCAICRVDFNNVFILNLHVRGHTSRCRECSVRVTYARYRHHAETHNKSLMLSNIDIPPELPKENTKKKIKLEKLASKPRRAETDDDDDSRGGLRRSRRLTR